jgi:signal transduction histidine kinase
MFQKIERAKQEWEVTVDALPQLVCLINAQGQILRANRTLESWGLGQVRDVKGCELHELIHPDCRQTFCKLRLLLTQSINKPVMSPPIELEIESTHLHRTLLVQVQPVEKTTWLSAGTLVVIVHDITHQKEAETALRSYLQMLADQNKELDTFAHTVAHDLQNPLGAIMGTTELLVSLFDSFSPEELVENLHLIAQGARKALNIIEELMLLTSVRKQAVQPEPIDMSPIVAEALRRLLDPIQQSGACIRSPECWPTVLGYAPWIEEVWVNYISNGIKYGGAPPCLDLGATCREDGAVQFWIRDNGVGIDPNQQALLFTPFSRLHQIRAQGYGLGLSIVQRIVTKLGGEVGVESDGHHGSLFFFTLPACDSESNCQQNTVKPPAVLADKI